MKTDIQEEKTITERWKLKARRRVRGEGGKKRGKGGEDVSIKLKEDVFFSDKKADEVPNRKCTKIKLRMLNAFFRKYQKWKISEKTW